MKKKILDYTALFEPAEEGGYIVSVPALPGCVTQGETFEEAVAMIKDAMEGYLAILQEAGQDVPEEKSDVVITKIAVTSPTAYL
jgi:antitoxin HicB